MTGLTVRLVEGHAPRLEVDAADVEVLTGPDRGQKHQLGNDSVIIGSSDACDWVLHDPTISARHCEISLGPKGYVVRDLDSTNGVILGNVTVQRAPLPIDVKMRIGETTLRVRAAGGQRTFPLAPPGTFGGARVTSLKMRALLAQLEQVAASDATVLLEGETGVGKEVAAEAIHAASARKHGPFIVLDCGAIPSELLGAELFGVERGAFTGADDARAGLLESADGGTLFLDEIGELPLELQPLLLGVIERKAARRMGGRNDVRSDVRIIAATNRNLAEEVRKKTFRQDLFFRLAVIRLRIPPLRERLDDLAALVDRLATETGARIPPETIALMAKHSWPGNVRELKNAIVRMSVDPRAPASIIGDETRAPGDGERQDLLDEGGKLRPLVDARRIAAGNFEERYLREALRRSGGSVSGAAELAGVSRQVMSTLAGRYGKTLPGK